MTEPVTLARPTGSPRTAADYAALAARRRRWFLLAAVVLSLIAAGAFVINGIDQILIPLSLLLVLVTPVLLWNFPRLSLYVLLIAVCLFECNQTGYTDALTDRVPFFWNVNTIFQVYAHANVKAIPLNLLEVFLVTAGVCSLLRAVFTGTAGLRAGDLFWPIMVFIGFVFMGWMNGLGTGGDFKISLQEVRSQFYFMMAYLMVVNLVREQRQVGSVLWIMVLCIGVKGILYTYRRYVTLGGMPLPDQGVGSHEEAFFFDCFEVLLILLLLCGVYKKLQWVMWAFLPFVITGNLATNRRAATAAMVIVVPVLILAAYRALPRRRRLVGVTGAILLVGFSIYYPLFKNSDSLLGQPARAIKSQFQPDERDAASNAYRDAENADLMATIKSAPLQGYGYGKRMFHVAPIADISGTYEWWDIMTHNQILWMWMRVGTFGFLAFWLMVCAILIAACRMIRRDDLGLEAKAVGLFALLVTSMLMLFGLLDMQLSNMRDMLFVGAWAGMVAAVPTLTPPLPPGQWRPGLPLKESP